MKRVFIQIVIAFLAIQSSGACEEPLVGSLVRSIGELRTISADFNVTIDGSSSTSGARVVNGRALFYQFGWLLDRQKGWQLFDGEFAMVDDSQWTYESQVFAWDGTDYIAYTRGLRRALKSGDPWFSFAGYKSPAVLVGDNVLSKFSIGLPELLDQAINVRSTGSQISAEFDWELKGSAPTHRVVVNVARGKQTLPKRIVLKDLSSGLDVVVVEVDGFVEDAASGLEFPVSGSIENFQATRRDDGSFSKRSLGVGKMHISVDPASVSINEPISKDRFSVKLPADVLWYDERTGERFVPEQGSINDVPNATNLPVILIALFAVAVLVLVVVIARRK